MFQYKVLHSKIEFWADKTPKKGGSSALGHTAVVQSQLVLQPTLLSDRRTNCLQKLKRANYVWAVAIKNTHHAGWSLIIQVLGLQINAQINK